MSEDSDGNIQLDGAVTYIFTGSDATKSGNRTTRNVARTRVLLMGIRQAVIIVLGLLEDFLELQRSIVPRRKRRDGS